MKTKKTLITLAVVAAVLLAALIVRQLVMLFFAFSMFLAPTCEIIEAIPSPDGKYVAYIFTLYSGTLDDHEDYNLTIRPAWMPAPSEQRPRWFFRGNGNTFVTEGCAFTVEWLSDKSVLVTVMEDGFYASQIEKQKERCFGKYINYFYD